MAGVGARSVRWIGFAMLAIGVSPPLSGQTPVHVEIIPTVGYFDLRGDPSTDLFVNEDAVGYQMRAGLVFGRHWGLEGYGGVIPSHFGAELGERRSSRSYVFGGTGTYRFANKSAFTPFLAAGAEIMDLDASDGEAEANPSIVYGGGLQIATGKKVAVRMEAKAHASKVTGRPCPPGPPPGPPPRKGGCGKGGGPSGDVVLADETTPTEVVESADFDQNPWLNHFEFSVGLVWRPWD